MTKLLWEVTKEVQRATAQRQQITLQGVASILNHHFKSSTTQDKSQDAAAVAGGALKLRTHETSTLRRSAQADPFPSSEKQRSLAATLGITPKQVRTWFINYRMRNKLRGFVASQSLATDSPNKVDGTYDAITHDTRSHRKAKDYLTEYAAKDSLTTEIAPAVEADIQTADQYLYFDDLLSPDEDSAQRELPSTA